MTTTQRQWEHANEGMLLYGGALDMAVYVACDDPGERDQLAESLARALNRVGWDPVPILSGEASDG